MKSVVFGASTGLGRALSEELAARGHELFLVSSNETDLKALASDLGIRSGARVHVAAFDLRQFDVAELKARILSALGAIDSVFYVAGVLEDEDTFPLAEEAIRTTIEVNFVSAVRALNALLPELRKSQSGNCVGIGSIAAVRARRVNLVYGSSKAALEFYFQGLRHELVGGSCRVQFYRLGYMKSQMTFGKKLLFPAAEPKAMARKIVANLGRDLGVVTLPFWWKYVMWVYRTIPWSIYKRLNLR